MIKVLVFDWGDTLMRDFPEFSGPMAHWPNVELMPYVAVALKAVKGKYKICVASNAGVSDGKLIGDAFERVGINEFFDYKFTSKELGFAKPDPLFYTEIIRRTGFKPEEHVMIGNDYIKDIKPAKQAGMNTILISNESSLAEVEFSDFIIEDMSELDSTLDDFNV